MEREDCEALFANGQGICLGGGKIWFLDVNFDGVKQVDEPLLKIITVSGVEQKIEPHVGQGGKQSVLLITFYRTALNCADESGFPSACKSLDYPPGNLRFLQAEPG